MKAVKAQDFSKINLLNLISLHTFVTENSNHVRIVLSIHVGYNLESVATLPMIISKKSLFRLNNVDFYFASDTMFICSIVYFCV